MVAFLSMGGQVLPLDLVGATIQTAGNHGEWTDRAEFIYVVFELEKFHALWAVGTLNLPIRALLFMGIHILPQNLLCAPIKTASNSEIPATHSPVILDAQGVAGPVAPVVQSRTANTDVAI